MDKDEALRLALKAFNSKYIVNSGAWRVQQDQAAEACEEALAQPEPKPVGSVVKWIDGSLIHGWFGEPPPEGTPLYTHPKEWVGLTDDEEILEISHTMPYANRFEFARAIEAKLRSKNT